MRLAIMQPYFFPYIGYFQLLNAVDEFIIYDNIEFTKKGWINRNRILVNGKDEYITLPLKKDSDYLDVSHRYLAETWPVERKKMLNKIQECYRKAPFFRSVFPLLEQILLFDERQLFKFILHSLELTKTYLDISTPLIHASAIPIDHMLRSENKVIALCKSRNAQYYINPSGGVELYSRESFGKESIELQFIKSSNIEYKQYENDFMPWLSVIDVMMFNTKEEIKKHLTAFTLF